MTKDLSRGWPGVLASVALLASGCSSSNPGDGGGPAVQTDSGAPADAARTEDAGAPGPPAPIDGSTSTPEGSSPEDSGPSGTCETGPQTLLHYAAGWTGDSPGSTLGFNLADVSSASAASALPAGFQALVWLGLCNGADSAFVSTVQPFIGNSKVYGFYLMDEPDPTGQYSPPACAAANLKAESDWIHANVPGTKTFIVLMNLGSDSAPTYQQTYSPANTGIDLYAVDPYPCKVANNGCDYSQINSAVTAAITWGIPAAQLVPAYQAFGGGGYSDWTLPTAAQAQTILSTWKALLPDPAFDYVYAWGSQQGDTALSQVPSLQAVFAAHNQSTCGPAGGSDG